MTVFDYLIIGKNPGGLAFADSILSGSDCTVAIIDDTQSAARRRQNVSRFISGGVREEHLGIGSYTLKDWHREYRPNNLKSLNRIADLQAYCTHVLIRKMLPSGRVALFERTKHFGDGRVKSIDNGMMRNLLVRKRIVDASHFPSAFCTSFIPSFSVAAGVNVVRPYQLDTILNVTPTTFESYCVLGGGRAGTEMVLALLDLGVATDKIRWVKSRDAWMLVSETRAAAANRSRYRMSRQHEALQAMAYAQNPDDLCLRLERLGLIVRTSSEQVPTYFLPHLITHEDAERLRQVEHVIRKGHVHAISEIGMLLSRGAVPMPAQSLYLDCTGYSGSRHRTKVVFQPQSIDLADIRLSHPCFSAAMIAAIELRDLPIEEKNKLSVPLDGGHIAELFLGSLLNHHAWFHDTALRNWIERCRLDPWLQITAQRLNASDRVPKDLGIIRTILPRAIINLESMVQRDNACVQ
ncbi:MAG: hypothetical protein AAGK80_11360 [Pseudomonadota bacterium]